MLTSTPIISWCITGGESDPSDPRPADTQWFRDVRDDCVKDGIAFFHKQNGGKKKGHGEVWGGDEIDGVVWHQFPYEK